MRFHEVCHPAAVATMQWARVGFGSYGCIPVEVAELNPPGTAPPPRRTAPPLSASLPRQPPSVAARCWAGAAFLLPHCHGKASEHPGQESHWHQLASCFIAAPPWARHTRRRVGHSSSGHRMCPPTRLFPLSTAGGPAAHPLDGVHSKSWPKVDRSRRCQSSVQGSCGTVLAVPEPRA